MDGDGQGLGQVLRHRDRVRDDIQAKYGHRTDYHNAEATAACLALVLAVEKAGSTEPNKVRDALAGLDTDSFFGRIKFDQSGKNIYKPMSVIQIQDGKAVTVWPTEAAEAKFVVARRQQ